MECRIVDQLDSGDRSVILADATDQHQEEGHSPLRKSDLAQKLSQDVLEALHQKRINDGLRDTTCIKKY